MTIVNFGPSRPLVPSPQVDDPTAVALAKPFWIQQAPLLKNEYNFLASLLGLSGTTPLCYNPSMLPCVTSLTPFSVSSDLGKCSRQLQSILRPAVLLFYVILCNLAHSFICALRFRQVQAAAIIVHYLAGCVPLNLYICSAV